MNAFHFKELCVRMPFSASHNTPVANNKKLNKKCYAKVIKTIVCNMNKNRTWKTFGNIKLFYLR